MKHLRKFWSWLTEALPYEKAYGVPPAGDLSHMKASLTAPKRGPWPCGLSTCFEAQTIIRQDENDTTVECPVHLCVTTWETQPRPERTQTIIRAQDAWHQHGVAGPPKR